MSITPSPPHVLNYTMFQDQQRLAQTHSPILIEKSSARRKQSYPTKASVELKDAKDGRVEGIGANQEKEEDDSGLDFSGNNPWCNLVKGKVYFHFIYFFISFFNCIS